MKPVLWLALVVGLVLGIHFPTCFPTSCGLFVLLPLCFPKRWWMVWFVGFLLSAAALGQWRQQLALASSVSGPFLWASVGWALDHKTFVDTRGDIWSVQGLPKDSLGYPKAMYASGVALPLPTAAIPYGFSPKKAFGPLGTVGLWRVNSFRDTLPAQNPPMAYWYKKAQLFAVSQVDRWRVRPSIASMVKALVFGDRRDMSLEQKSSYARLGLAHIVSISGFHMGLIFAVFAWLARRSVTKGGWLWEVLGLLAVFVFVGLSGSATSAVRSAFMSCLSVFFVWTRRRQTGLPLLFPIVFLLLFLKPLWAFDVGFQLSILSLFGIMAWVPSYQGRWAWLKESIAISWCAQMATLPVTLPLFHQFPLLFIASNMLAVPLFTALLPVWIVRWILGLFFGEVWFFDSFQNHFVAPLLEWIVWFGNLPWVAWMSLYPSLERYLLVCCVAVGTAAFWRVGFRRSTGTMLSAMGLIFVAAYGSKPLNTSHLVCYKTTFAWVLEFSTPEKQWAYCTANQVKNDFFWEKMVRADVLRRGKSELPTLRVVPSAYLRLAVKQWPEFDATAVYQQWDWTPKGWRRALVIDANGQLLSLL